MVEAGNAVSTLPAVFHPYKHFIVAFTAHSALFDLFFVLLAEAESDYLCTADHSSSVDHIFGRFNFFLAGSGVDLGPARLQLYDTCTFEKLIQ